MPKEKIHKEAIRRIFKYKNFSGLVVISEALKKDFFQNYSIKEDKILVAHDGADIVETTVENAFEKLSGVLDVGYTGSLHPGKGAEIIPKLAEALPDMRFHIVGGMPSQIKAIKKHDLPNLVFYGHVPHSALPAYLKNFDILLAPYQEKSTIRSGADIARWISPMKIFEYMAAQKPIICSDLPVLREILEDQKTALLLPCENIESWKQAILSLAKDENMRFSLAFHAFEKLKSHYTWDTRAKNILKFISQNS